MTQKRILKTHFSFFLILLLCASPLLSVTPSVKTTDHTTLPSTNLKGTFASTIEPLNSYIQTITPLHLNTTGNTTFETITLYYRHSNDNISFTDWMVYNHSGIRSWIEQITPQAFLSYWQDLVAHGPRVTGTPACGDTADWITSQWQTLNLSSRIHHWTSNGYQGNNTEATLQGHNHSSDNILLVMAHYDTVPNSPGADDNAAGAAAVLLAGDILRHHGFHHTIRFVHFDGEEQGLLGSKEYVTECTANLDNIYAALNADMISYAPSNNGSNVNIIAIDNSWWIANHSQTIAAQYTEQLHNLTVTRILDIGPSDHRSFTNAGYHAVCFHEHLTYLANPHYHQPTDTIDNNNLFYAVNVTRLLVATLADLAVPLQWSFEFHYPNGTGYYEFFSLGIKDNTTEPMKTTADARCYHPQTNSPVLTIQTIGNGNVSCLPSGICYPPGTTVTLIPEPEPGWIHQGWMGPNANDLQTNPDGTFTITMTNNKHLIALFMKHHSITFSSGWNLFSLPLNHLLNKTDLAIQHTNTTSWNDAVAAGIILDTIFEWNTSTQTCNPTNMITPGKGYWAWAYHPCILHITYNHTNTTTHLTSLRRHWNLIGLPINITLPKHTLLIHDNTNTYNWTEATTGPAPLLLSFVFQWNATSKNYHLTNTLCPGQSYWVYAYHPCRLTT